MASRERKPLDSPIHTAISIYRAPRHLKIVLIYLCVCVDIYNAGTIIGIGKVNKTQVIYKYLSWVLIAVQARVKSSQSEITYTVHPPSYRERFDAGKNLAALSK